MIARYLATGGYVLEVRTTGPDDRSPIQTDRHPSKCDRCHLNIPHTVAACGVTR